VTLKICLVAPLPPPYGGIAHWAQMIVRHSAATDRADIAVVNTAPTWRSIHTGSALVRVFGGGLQLIRDLFALARLCRARKFDAIHLTTSGHLAALRDCAIAMLASLMRLPLVYHIRFGRVPALVEANSLEWRLLRRVMEASATVILIDDATFKAVRQGAPGVASVLLPNCVDIGSLPQRTPGARPDKVALFLGWVVPTKGVGELVSAWMQVRPPGWRLDIVGPVEAGYRDALLRVADPDAVRIVGPLRHEDAMGRMADCDLFVLPSHTEGFPNVVVEAMALGRPIVASAVGAIPEMLAEGAGLLVQPDDVTGLADALRRLLSNEQSMADMGRRALSRANNLYDIEAVYSSYLHIWRSVSGQRSTGLLEE
jgi:glycosyltransferase involved in cell wall biosynthesis